MTRSRRRQDKKPALNFELKALANGPFIQLAILLAIAMMFGGGGSSYAMRNLVVHLAALSILAINRNAVVQFFRSAPRPLVMLTCATFALPVLHLIPMPPEVWQALPGRDLVSQSLGLIGKEAVWYPLSLDRGRTFGAAFALVAPFTILVLCNRLRNDQADAVLLLIAGLALFCLLLGAVQMLTDRTIGDLFPGKSPGVLYGFFANRNTTAALLVMATALLVPYLGAKAKSSRVAVLSGLVLLSLGTILTQSRSGFMLLMLVIVSSAASFVISRNLKEQSAKPRRLLLFGLAVIVSVMALGTVLATNDRLRPTIERFADAEQGRPQIWADAMSSAERFWPLGGGMGTFDEVFQLDESFEYLVAARAGRAHNDYLEIAIEAGIFGIVLVAGWISFVIIACLKSGRSNGAQRWVLLSLTVVALQSMVDYPLRNVSMLCIVAALIAYCFKSHKATEPA